MNKEIVQLIKFCLSDELLVKGRTGHCYVASEAYYHLCGGKGAGLKSFNMKWEGSSHWFLKDGDEIIDLTADQFKSIPDYNKAVGRGFLTKKASKRAAFVIRKVYDYMGS